MVTKNNLILSAAFCGFLTVSNANAQLLNVDFNAANNNGNVGTYSGAAVLGSVGDYWNGIDGHVNHSGTGIALKDATNTTTGVTLDYSADNAFDIAPYSPLFTGTYASLLNDYLYAGSNGIALTIKGLTPNAAYALALYAVANNVGRTTFFSVNGSPTQSVVAQNTGGILTQGSTYALFNTTADGNGWISVSGTRQVGGEADLNGFQLSSVSESSSVPEPSTALLFSVGGILFAIRRRRTIVA